MEEIRKFYDINDQSVHPCMRGARYQGPMDKVVMSANLADFQMVMNKHEIPFFISFGTLLGAIRTGDFMDYDTDADVGILYPRIYYLKMKAVKADLVALGFNVADKNEIYPLNDWLVRNGERIEIFWFMAVEDEFIYTDKIRYPKTLLSETIEYDFLGLKINIPKRYNDFLAYHYGTDWKEPKQNQKGPVTEPIHKKTTPIVLSPTTLEEFENELRVLIERKKQLKHTINHLRKQADASK